MKDGANQGLVWNTLLQGLRLKLGKIRLKNSQINQFSLGDFLSHRQVTVIKRGHLLLQEITVIMTFKNHILNDYKSLASTLIVCPPFNRSVRFFYTAIGLLNARNSLKIQGLIAKWSAWGVF
jgi:hypothetical protein